MLKHITASVLALLVAALGAGVVAEASELTGTLLLQSGGSTQTGSLSFQVGGNETSANAGGSGNGGGNVSGGGGGGGRSGTRQGQAAIVSDPIIFIDTIPGPQVAQSGGRSQALGTGGGFDAGLEEFLSASEDSSLSADEAVAFNQAQNPLANNDLVAQVGGTGMGSAKIWTAIVLGLALLGLAGYAVSALISYRRENDL